MADRLREELSVEVELIRGARGIFEVAVGDRVVASKTSAGFPTEQACVEAVRSAIG